MTAIHLHLALNHAPLLGFAFGLICFLLGQFRSNLTLRSVGVVAVFVSALLVIPVYLSGEGSEDAAERLLGSIKPYLDPHEDAAKITAIAAGVSGVFAGVMGLALFRNRTCPSVLSHLFWLVVLGTLLLFARTALLGGKIRHDEIRQPAVQSEVPEADEHE